MDGPRRSVASLVALVALSALFAGCSDDEEDIVLRADAIGVGDVDVFNVPKGTSRIQFMFSTEPGGGLDCSDPQMANTAACLMQYSHQYDEEEDDGQQAGTLRFAAGPESDQDGEPTVFATLAFNKKTTRTVLDPKPGKWFIGTESDDGYQGPSTAHVVVPATTTGGVLNLGPFWDIVGVAIAVAALVGGWWILHRRRRFMTRQLGRIEEVVLHSRDDITECRINLNELKKELNQMLVRRKIEEPQYIVLERRIEQYLKDLETPGNRHEVPTPAPAPESITVLESEEALFPVGSALRQLRESHRTED